MQFETNYEESDSLYTQFCYSKLRRQTERERERQRDGTRDKRQFHLPFEMERNRSRQE